MQYLRVQYIASPNKWNLWQISSMVCLYVKPRYLENCHFFDLFWQTFARPLHGGVSFPFEICMPCWKHPSANQQYEETHEEETSAAGFQQQMPDVDHFIKGRKNGTTVRAIIWLIFCLWKIRVRKEICQYVHGGLEGGFCCTQFTNQEHNTELKSRQYMWQCDCSTAWTQQYPQWVSLHDGHNGDTEGRLKQMETHYLRWSSTPANDIGVFNNREKLVGDKVIVISILHSRSKTTSSSWVQ